MNTSEYNDAQLLWKMFYARECFRQARLAAQHILNAKLEREDLLFYPLLTAVHVLYAKPFTRADGVGKLGEDIIAPEHLDLHRLLLQHRNQIYAHRDADGFDVADYGAVSQVRAMRLPRKVRLFGTDFHARFPAMPSIVALCETLEEKSDYHVNKLWTRYLPAVPTKVAEYLLNIQDPNADMWLPQQPMCLKTEA